MTNQEHACPHRYPFDRPSAVQVPPIYERLRVDEPVAKVSLPSGDEGYIVSRYEDAKFVLSDNRFSRAATTDPNAPKLTHITPPPGSLFTLDPPEHTRLRTLVAGQFTTRRVRNLIPRIQQITDDLVDRMEQQGPPTDLNQALAFPMPITVICELLGVPFSDRDRFRKWSDAVVSLTTHTEEEMLAERMAMAAYMKELIDGKRVEPGDDLMSALITAHDEHGSLNEIELIIMAMTLLVAGHETTVSMIGACVLSVLRDDAHRELILNHPDRVNSLVEELLRINPIGDGGPLRITLTDVEVADTVIPKGSAVMAAICSANRDTAKFTDPETVLVGRPDNQHLAFGYGVHHCLGAPLARAELNIALSTLFRRLPTLKLATDVDTLRMKSGMMVHGLEALPVTW
jgi:cytochrome P450